MSYFGDRSEKIWQFLAMGECAEVFVTYIPFTTLREHVPSETDKSNPIKGDVGIGVLISKVLFFLHMLSMRLPCHCIELLWQRFGC